MKKHLLVASLILAVAGGGSVTAQVTKKKTGIGFDNYGTYQTLNIGPVRNGSSKRAGNGRTGASDVPVYSAKRRGVKIRRLKQLDASTVALQLYSTGGMTMGGVPIYAGDMMGSLRIVRYDKHVFGVVDGLRKPLRGSVMNDQELGRNMTAQVEKRTGCALNGPPLMQFQPGRMGKLSVPLACQ
jgi:hypothetical protein